MILACEGCIDFRDPEGLQWVVGPALALVIAAILVAFVLGDLASRSAGRARVGALVSIGAVLLAIVAPLPLVLEQQTTTFETLPEGREVPWAVSCGKAVSTQTDIGLGGARSTHVVAARHACDRLADDARRTSGALASIAVTLAFIGAVLLVSSRGRGLVQQQKPFSFRPDRGSHWTQSSLR
jgi:hypothetical protein